MDKYKILIADDDMEIIELTKSILELDNYDVTAVYNGNSAVKKAKELKPDLVLVDFQMPDINGAQVCKALKDDQTTRYIPVVILSGTNTKVHDKVVGLQVGADDYMIKPFDPDELKARIAQSIKRTRDIISLNPLTKLPGSTRIEEEINRRIGTGEKFAVGYVDLDNFKAYNDVYGYPKGDNVIHLLHQVIFEAISLCGTQIDFIGHIGGDDFIIVTIPDKVDNICGYITKNFDQRISAHYTPDDRQKGFIITTDRKGSERTFPIMTVSIGIATNSKRDINHYGQIITILIEMKKFAKTLEKKEGSTYAQDRRIF